MFEHINFVENIFLRFNLFSKRCEFCEFDLNEFLFFCKLNKYIFRIFYNCMRRRKYSKKKNNNDNRLISTISKIRKYRKFESFRSKIFCFQLIILNNITYLNVF